MSWGKANGVDKVECSLHKKPCVELNLITYSHIKALTKELSTEWMGFLIGEQVKDTIRVTGIEVPPQQAGMASAEVDEKVPMPAKCIGIVHSHANMGAFHSHTDRECVDSNFPISLTVCKGQDMSCTAMVKTACGKLLLYEDVVVKVTLPYVNTTAWVEKVRSNVKSRVVTQYGLGLPNPIYYNGIGGYGFPD